MCIYFLKFVYLQSMGCGRAKRERERERERIPNRPLVVSMEPDAGLDIMNPMNKFK